MLNQDDDDSSAHTSAAAADSDDVAHMEDTNMDPDDFNFHVEPTSPTRHGPAALLSIPNVEKFNSLLDSDLTTNIGLATPPTFNPTGRTFSDGEGGGSEADRMATAITQLPTREEQLAMVKEVLENKGLNEIKPGDTRFVVSLRYARWRKCLRCGMNY